jgi:sorbitol-6-phosphate 2-dehydrogenase
MSKILQDRIALVTGGAQGLGEAICHRLAHEGAHIIVADINLEGSENVADDIRRRTDRNAIGVQVDVSNELMVEQMFSRIIAEFGKLDVMVSNAGVLFSGAVDEIDVEKWRMVIEINLVGYFLCLKYATRLMKNQGSGSIIQVNSKSGKKGSFKNSAYAASKFGGIGLTQSAALELAEFGVRINSLYKQYAANYGITEEEVRHKYIDQVPMKRGCTYDDVCNVIVFLASDQSSYMTGQAINVTGGQEMR